MGCRINLCPFVRSVSHCTRSIYTLCGEEASKIRKWTKFHNEKYENSAKTYNILRAHRHDNNNNLFVFLLFTFSSPPCHATMEILLVIEDEWIMMENIISLPHSSMSTRNWKDERGQTCSRSIGNLLWRLEDVVISFYSLFQWNKASDRKINLFFPQKLRQTALLWVQKCHIRYYYKRNLPHVI